MRTFYMKSSPTSTSQETITSLLRNRLPTMSVSNQNNNNFEQKLNPMARPIPQLEDLAKIDEEIKPKESKSIIDFAVDSIRNKSTKHLILGTITVRPRPPSEEPKPAVIQKPEPYKPDEPFEKPLFPTKPIPHPPKISPSSIPNPNPSVTANMETAYPNYTGFLYNIPGYSAFQPVNYSNTHPQPMHTEAQRDFKPFTITGSREVKELEEKFERREDNFARREDSDMESKEIDPSKQQDFEDNFTMKIIPPTSKSDAKHMVESKMSITSLAQGSGGSVTIPSQINKDMKKKTERYSLKTSIPISKIDMKCVSSPVDTAFQNAIKKPVFNPAFQKEVDKPKVEIQSNIVIKTATADKDAEAKEKPVAERENLRHKKPLNLPAAQNNSISTLINAAEAINKNDNQFRVPEPKADAPKEAKDPPVSQSATAPRFTPKDVSPATSQQSGSRHFFNPAKTEGSKQNLAQPTPNQRPIFNPISSEASKTNSAPSTATQRPIFNPVSVETNKANSAQPQVPQVLQRPMFNPEANKTNSSQSSGIQRPILNPTTAEGSKLNAAQASIQRPNFSTVSEASKITSTPPSTLQRSIFNPVSVETSKPSLTPAIVQRSIFNPLNTEASKVTQSSAMQRPVFNPVSSESIKPNFPNKPPDGGYNEPKNLMFLQNQKQNPKMLLTIQPNPQVLLQRTNFESKNLQAPSRLSSQSKKSEVIADTSSKVVALKRLHQDNCDENDFENLITENQIYGNKIVVKEKSQGSQEEWKNKVKVEKQTEEHWKTKLKIDINLDKPTESKNVVLQPNFLYLSNVQFPANLMMIKNNSKICQTTDSTKMKVSPNENRTTDVAVNNNNIETNTTIKNPKPHNVTINKEVHVLKSSNNVLQTLSNNNNKTDVVFQTNQKVIVTPQVIYQVPIIVTEAEKDQIINEPKLPTQKKEPPKIEAKSDKVILTCQVDAKVPKIVIANLRPKITTSPKLLEEVSTLDLYEKKKRLRRLKYLSSNKEVPKDPIPTAKKLLSKPAINVITPENMRAEIFKEFAQTKEKREAVSSESESDSDEDELEDYNTIIERFGPNYNENAKTDFLAEFNLATREVFREKQLERHERTLKFDAIASAYMAAGRLDPLTEDQPSSPEPQTKEVVLEEDKTSLLRKQQFLTQFKLIRVSPSYKADYEKSWRQIIRERNRRYGIPNPEPFDPDSQLQILTEINKSVNENNDLIKKRLDSICDENSDIRILAEKNFSELNRLSKMADRSVKLFSGKDTKKRDLNPGFDSENIKKFKVDPKEFPKLNIPNITKIISLQTVQESSRISSTQATSMDEPVNSASSGKVMTTEVGCQADEQVPWEGVTDVMDEFIRNYRKYEIARKKEMDDLQRSQTRLRIECAHVTRSASRDSDRARALLAERQLLAGEEANLKTSLERLNRAIEAVKRS